MESFASKSSVTHRSLRYLAACLATSSALACASDDSESEQDEKSQTATEESDSKSSKAAKDTSDTADKNAATKDKEEAPDTSPEAAAKRDEEANPGSAAVMRFDGSWKGTSSQDKPVSFKILNRFLAHIEVGYKLDGDGCSADEALVKLSAMQPLRMNAFMLTNTTATEKLVMSGSFSADDEAAGEYSIEVVGDAPKDCNTSVSGTWKASK